MAKKPKLQTPPIEIDGALLPPLGMTPADFLRDYWQKRPLLIRNAVTGFSAPGFVPPICAEELAGLACESAALSRIVSHDRASRADASDTWQLQYGPFPEEMFPGMREHDWTLLVQDVDKWDPDVAALMSMFDFLPRWRIDDVMVSFAAPGGSVGAHVDQYDVFLLQAQGHRRWQIDVRPDPPLAFRQDVELKLLQQFDPTHDWVLGPGDMLYLPPGVPHHGVAQDACLTYSIGMRAPAAAELLGDFVDTLASDADDRLRYRDPDLTPAKDPNEIDKAAMARVVEALNLLRMNDPERLGDWFGSFITTYRSVGEVAADPEQQPPPRIEAEWQLEHGLSLSRHPLTRMAWRRARRGARLYVNGQAHSLPLRDARTLAAAANVDDKRYAGLSQIGRDLVMTMLAEGHYQMAEATGMDDQPDDDPVSDNGEA